MLYQIATAVFGHSQTVNRLRNRYTDNDVTVHPSARIGRRTGMYGDVTIGPGVSISWHCTLRSNVDIGKGTNLNGRNKVIGDVSIGKYCAIAPRARVRSTAHPIQHPSMQAGLYESIGAEMSSENTGAPIDIRNDVWICADSKILSGVTVGNGAIIAANSVVVDDVEPYSFVAGNPARHKKYRFDEETREKLAEIRWWDWSDKKKRANKAFFESNLRQVDDIQSLIAEPS